MMQPRSSGWESVPRGVLSLAGWTETGEEPKFSRAIRIG